MSQTYVSFDDIEKELDNLKIIKFDGCYWYFYCLLMDDMAIAKPGSGSKKVYKSILRPSEP